jgi:hypothetical protein
MRNFNHYVIVTITELTFKSLFIINCATFAFGIISLIINIAS